MFHRLLPALLLLCLSFTLLSWNDRGRRKTYTVKGETIALAREAPSFLLKKDARIRKVYMLDAQGNEKVFAGGTDYVAVPGGLKRTAHSSIPDFAAHKMILNPNGRFTWRNDPGMNPQLAIPWQLMVDYTTSENAAVAPQGRYLLGDALKNKLLAKKPLTMYSIGTSITEGAHTLAKYFRNSDESVYPRLVAKAITRLHGSEVTLHNIAVGGSTSALLTAKTDYLLEQRPDVVLIEFGMNEHLPGAGMDRYLAGIEQAVKKLRAAGIDCVLIGFFQQNPQWDLEDVPSTLYFNNKLREMAGRNGVFFADIHARFENIPADKLYRDLMGDYLHHPTAFGHQLYYLSTMPVFLFKQSREAALLGAIAQ